MKWTIRVELTPDGNPPITYEIGTITRPIGDLSPEQIGLTLEEGQQLLRRVQVEIIASQAHAYALCRRACVDCGRAKRAASRVLKTCGFDQMRASHMAIRRHTLAIGRELEAHRLMWRTGKSSKAPRTRPRTACARRRAG
jgi:hypothetical protein